jgi:type II secretory pathway pseudopilin PulG
MISKLTLQSKINKDSSDGFTLIEIIGVLFLIALIMGVAVPGLRSQYRYYIRTSARELAATFSYLYDTAILTQKTYRIVYDLEKGAYWVESAAGRTLISPTPEARSLRVEFVEDEKKKDSEPRVEFVRETGKLAKERKLGTGVRFTDIILKRLNEPVTSGITYTYILPQGYVEETWVHMSDKNNQTYTVKVNPLTGHTKIYKRRVEPGENER